MNDEKMRKTKRSRKQACPKCGSVETVPILYGYPARMKETMEAVEKGLIALGGCCFSGDEPRKRCKACGEGFDFPPPRRTRRPRIRS